MKALLRGEKLRGESWRPGVYIRLNQAGCLVTHKGNPWSLPREGLVVYKEPEVPNPEPRGSWAWAWFELKRGKRVRRPLWSEDWRRGWYLDGGHYLCLVVNQEQAYHTAKSLDATDWELC